MFSFRFRVDFAPGCAVSSDASVLPLLETSEGQQIELAGVADQPISKSSQLVLKGRGWVTREEAEEAGNRLADAFALALVGSRIGVEGWARRRVGMFFNAGLRLSEKQLGQRVLEDSVGLSVYETNPPPGLVSPPAVTLKKGVSANSVVTLFRGFAATPSDVWTWCERLHCPNLNETL